MKIPSSPGNAMIKYAVTVVCCWICFCAPASADPPAQVFYLAAADQVPDESGNPLLVRELTRQAFLIAARDEMGLYTRDGAMREWTPDANGNPPADAQGKPAFQIDMHRLTKNLHQLTVDLYSLGTAKTLLATDTFSIPTPKGSRIPINGALEIIEPFSRGKYVEQLKAAGYSSQAKPHGDGVIPVGVDALLYQTTLMAPFSAIQQVHAAIRDSGESPARLSALVRGYANLGQLTWFQWSTIHKVLTARSLLYAQRLVNEDSSSPFAYYNRAYAYAFAGLPAAAMDDLAEAKKHEAELTAAGKPLPQIPKWVALLEPFCKYDVERLVAMGPRTDARAPLVALMVFIDEENCGSVSEVMGLGHAALEINGACFRIMDAMMNQAGVASGHEMSELAPQAMLETLPADIKLLPTVPASTVQALANAHGNNDHVGNLKSVTDSFLAATEQAEPSFALVGRLLQETTFVHVARRARFMADFWGVDCSDYVDFTSRLIADHPYQAYVQSLKLPYNRRIESMTAMEVTDPQWQMYYMLATTWNSPQAKGHMNGSIGWHRMHADFDGTSQEIQQKLLAYGMDDKTLKECAHMDLALNAYSALAAGTLVKTDFKFAEPNLDEWNKRFATQPAFLCALATYWNNAQNPDKAEPLLRQLVQVAPDRKYIEQLANLYLARGDEADWLSTLKIVLTQPDYALDHSWVEAEIARHYMAVGNYNSARKYADASFSDSFSQWSMQVDELAAEYQEDYASAEKIVRQEAERYDASAWYFWCKRTGHGDVAAAKTMADNWLAAVQRGQAYGDPTAIGCMLYAAKDTNQAKAYLDRGMHEQHNCFAAIQLALICTEKKDDAGRDAAVKFAVENCKQSLLADAYNYEVYVSYAKLMQDSPTQIPTDDQVENILKTDRPNSGDRVGVYYFQGKQLQLNGNIEEAKKSYRKAAAAFVDTSRSYMLACDALHQLGETTTLPKKIGP